MPGRAAIARSARSGSWPLADVGTSHPIDDPLADGVYYAIGYAVTADGAGVEFELVRFYDIDACIATLDTEPSGTVDRSGCYGGWVDTSTTAVVTMSVDIAAPVVLVSSTLGNYAVSAEEFARLLSGEPPSPDAPSGIENQGYWGDGRGGRWQRGAGEQQPSS